MAEAIIGIRERVAGFRRSWESLSYPLSGKNRAVVEKHSTDRMQVSFLHEKDEVSRRFFEARELTLEICNPFKLVQLAAPASVSQELRHSLARIDHQASSPFECIRVLRESAFLSPLADISYYSLYLIVKKLLQRNIPKEQVPEAIEALKWLALSAMTEEDIPRIAYLNGCFCLLQGEFNLAEIERLWPGITTDNLVGSLCHVMR